MENFHLEGKPCEAADVRSLLFSLANKMKNAVGIFGSVDSDPYGLQTVFSWGDQMISISYCDLSGMKGGEL